MNIVCTSISRLVFASRNAGKLHELFALFSPLGIQLIAQDELGVSEIPEPYPTFIENALAKARHASRSTGLPVLADDSGLCVNALAGAPGVLSARYAQSTGGMKSDHANNAKLINNLHNMDDRRAYYVAVLVLLNTENDPCPIIGEGYWEGEIIDTPRGNHGFGYDPHFYLPELNRTAAELASAEKNRISHRAQALQQLLRKLKVKG